MASGGARQGTPGTAYPQRNDLNSPKPLAPTAATGQTYGAAGAQIASQRAVPMAPPPALGAGGPAPQPQQPAPTGPMPGSFGAFTRPTERPDEPLTAGLPSGPGPGPEALNVPAPAATAADVLSRLAATPGSSPDVAFLASWAAGGRQ